MPQDLTGPLPTKLATLCLSQTETLSFENTKPRR